jgi:CheY-like chemotaxis protein
MKGMRILVVEDEYLLASELAGYFRSVGAEVLGPVPSLAGAIEFIDQADAAILDINLNGETVFPLADVLQQKGVPFVFFSGLNQILLPERFRYSPSLSKPGNWRDEVRAFLAQHSQRQVRDKDDIREILPKLRLAARLLLKDPSAADRLVERTLEAAINEAADQPVELGRAEWLNALMERILDTDRHDILN